MEVEDYLAQILTEMQVNNAALATALAAIQAQLTALQTAMDLQNNQLATLCGCACGEPANGTVNTPTFLPPTDPDSNCGCA